MLTGGIENVSEKNSSRFYGNRSYVVNGIIFSD